MAAALTAKQKLVHKLSEPCKYAHFDTPELANRLLFFLGRRQRLRRHEHRFFFLSAGLECGF